MIQFGTVKWFGGYSSSTNKENDYGLVHDFTGRDLFLHRKQWDCIRDPLENQIVCFESAQHLLCRYR